MTKLNVLFLPENDISKKTKINKCNHDLEKDCLWADVRIN